MAVATGIFAIYFFIASIVNLVRFLSWFKKPREKGTCQSQKLAETSARGKKRFEYEIAFSNAGVEEVFTYSESVGKDQSPSLFKGDSTVMLLNRESKTVISEKDFAAMKKNLYVFPLLWLLSVALTYGLIYISSLF